MMDSTTDATGTDDDYDGQGGSLALAQDPSISCASQRELEAIIVVEHQWVQGFELLWRHDAFEFIMVNASVRAECSGPATVCQDYWMIACALEQRLDIFELSLQVKQVTVVVQGI